MAEAADFIENADPARPEAAVFTLSARGGLRSRAACAWINLQASLAGRAHPHLGLLATKVALASSAGRLNITRLPSPMYDRKGRKHLRTSA